MPIPPNACEFALQRAVRIRRKHPNRITVQLNFQELTHMYEIQSNPPFCRLFSISFDLIRKLLSQNPSSFNAYTKCLKLFFFSVSFSKINPKKERKKNSEIENKTKNKRNFNKQELIKRKNNCFYQLLSAFSDAKQTRSFTDSHINVLACEKNALYTKKQPIFNVQ